jgi:hypothetical protein
MILTVVALLSVQQATPDILTESETGKWNAKSEIPSFEGKSALVKFANEDIRKVMTKRFDSFVATMRKEFEPGIAGQESSFEASAIRGVVSPKLISFSVLTYRYLGGAHGLGTTETFNYALLGKKPKRLGVDDLFLKSKRKELSQLLYKTARKNPMTDWLQPSNEDMFKGFSLEQMNRFWFPKAGRIAWEFDPYELGSYAAGPFTFEFRLGALSGMAKKELRGVALP